MFNIYMYLKALILNDYCPTKLEWQIKDELCIPGAFDTGWKLFFFTGDFMLLLERHFSCNLRLESDSVYTRHAKLAALFEGWRSSHHSEGKALQNTLVHHLRDSFWGRGHPTTKLNV